MGTKGLLKNKKTIKTVKQQETKPTYIFIISGQNVW